MIKRLPEELEEEIVQSLELGLTQKQVSLDHHVSLSTVNRISIKHFGKDTDMDKVIAGDVKHGTLRCVGNNLFVGTCKCANGRMRKKRFHADPKSVTDIWEKWKESVREEEAQHAEKVHAPETIQAAVDIFDKPLEEATKPETPVPVEEATKPETPAFWKESSSDDSPIYILGLNSPRITGFFTDFEEAMRVEAIMNSAMEHAGIQNMRYSVQEVARYVVD